jgi:hypothetical protein
VAFFLSLPNRLGSRLLVDDHFLLLFLGAIQAKEEKKKKRVGVTYYVKTRKWWRISDSVCGQRTFFVVSVWSTVKVRTKKMKLSVSTSRILFLLVI